MTGVPTTTNYPTSLDSSATLFGDPVNGLFKTLSDTINDTVQSFVVEETITEVNVPTFFCFPNGEIVYCETKDNGTKTFSDVTRGVGSTATAHTAGDIVKQILVAEYIHQFKDAILAIEAKVGIDSSAVATSVDYFNLNHAHTGGADGQVLTIAPASVSPQGAASTLDADLLDGQHGTYYGTATAVTAALTQELPIMASMAPLSGYVGAGLELIESSGAGTAKPVIPQLNFPKTEAQGRMWTFKVKETPGATITVKVSFRMSSANTSDEALFGCQLACVSSGDGSMSAKTFATTNEAALSAADDADKQAEGTITLTNKDSIAKDDWVCLFLYRNPIDALDTAAGNALVTSVALYYT